LPVPTQEQVIEFCHDNSVIDYLGIDIVPDDDGGVHLEIEVEEQHSNPYNILHGGVMTTMADTAMGAACLMRNKKVVTVSITLEFMHPVHLGSRIITDAKIINEGRHVMVCECELVDANKKIFAKAHAVFFAIAKFIDD